MSRTINTCKGEVPLIFSLRGRYWKNYGGKAVKHWELKLALLVTGEDIFIFNGCMCSCCIAEDREFWINHLSKDISTPWISSWFPHIFFIKIKVTIICSHSRFFCVGVFRQLLCQNIITKLRDHFIDYGPCVNSLFHAIFRHPSIH